jgi:hypothetical protein
MRRRISARFDCVVGDHGPVLLALQGRVDVDAFRSSRCHTGLVAPVESGWGPLGHGDSDIAVTRRYIEQR